MTTLKILKYQLRDVIRSRWILFYGLFFLVATDALFRFGGDGERVMVSLMNVVLYVIPLAAAMLGALYLYNSREYVELLLAQPIRRRSLFRGLYLGLAGPMVAAFVAGTGLPFLYHGELGGGLAILLLCGALLTAVFVAIAFAIALATEDRVKGVGMAMLSWLFFAVVYNGLTLLAIQLYSDYPLQKPVIAMIMLNPIDLGRILLLLNLEVSALMGFTGAVFRRFFGSGLGQALTAAALFVWVAVPFLVGERSFLRKNF